MSLSKSYSEEFRLGAIDLVKSSSKSVNKIAEDLGVAPSTLARWIKDGINGENTESEVREIRALRKELAEARMERDILKNDLPPKKWTRD